MDQAEQVLRICVFHTCEEDEGASNAAVSIAVEGTEVLGNCGSVGHHLCHELELPTKKEVHF